jgi:hypothetical protein
VRGLVLALGIPRVGLRGIREESCNTLTILLITILEGAFLLIVLIVAFIS